MGKRKDAHSQTLYKETESLEHTVLNGMSSSNPSLRSSGKPAEEQAQRVLIARGNGVHQENKAL